MEFEFKTQAMLVLSSRVSVLRHLTPGLPLCELKDFAKSEIGNIRQWMA
jgi:hypothetical protein